MPVVTGPPITGLNAGFLHLETATSPLNVVGVVWIDDTAGSGFTRDAYAGRIAELVDRALPLRQRPVRHGRGLVWADGPVDLDHHIRGVVAPSGAGAQFVLDVAAEMAGKHLPRDRPLWMHTVVEGIAGPDGATAALVTSIHHARNDGLGALAALAVLAGAPVPEPDTAAPASLVRRAARRVRGTATFVRVVARVVRRRRAGERVPRESWMTPRLPISRSITTDRVLTTVEVPVADMAEIRRAFGVSFNDAYLALVAGAVRTWLGPACPDVPVVAIVPLSTRAGVDTPTNRIGMYSAGLPVHLPDPGDRVRDVTDEMAAVKTRHEDHVDVGLDTYFDALPWAMIGRRFSRYAERGRADVGRLAANLVASSIAGPREILTLGNARLVGMDAFGPVFDGITLNVTGLTYVDRLRIGITGARGIEPGVDALVDAIRAEAAILVAAAREHTAGETSPPEAETGQ